MRVVSKPIDMITYVSVAGIPKPVRFLAQGKKQKNYVVDIKKILECKEERLAGNQMYVYKCQTEFNGEKRLMELKYEVGQCLWYLFRV